MNRVIKTEVQASSVRRSILALCTPLLFSACVSYRAAVIHLPAARSPEASAVTAASLVSDQEASSVIEVVDKIAAKRGLNSVELTQRPSTQTEGANPLVAMYVSPAPPGGVNPIVVSIHIAANRSEVAVGVADRRKRRGSKELDEISQEIRDGIERKFPDRSVSTSCVDVGWWREVACPPS
jgi:hypothetical protein